MFGQKKTARPSSGQKKHDLGIFGMGMDFDPMGGMNDADDDDDNDDDLEAELAALQGGQSKKKPARPKKKVMDISAIDAMAAECMKDVDEIEDDDVDDVDLLAELEGLSPMDTVASMDTTPALVPSKASNESAPGKSQGGDISVISERKTMYETAIANAEKAGDGGKARRYKRGLKEIEKLLKAAQNGRPVNMAELPPQVATGGEKPAPPSAPVQPSTSSNIPDKPLIDLGTPSEASTSAPQPSPRVAPPRIPAGASTSTQAEKSVPAARPEPPVTPQAPPVTPQAPPVTPQAPPSASAGDISETVKGLALKRDQFKLAARNSNRDGDKETAKTYLLISKEFDIVIQAVKDGRAVDLTQCPPPPPGFPGGAALKPTPSEEPSQSSSLPTQPTASAGASTTSEACSNQGPPPAPKTVLEALEQRLEKYNSGVQDAEKEGNSGKARRMKRIVKQYQDAIRDHKAKKPLNLEELPTPPGYPPFPTESPSPPQQATAARQPPPKASQPQAAPAKAPVKRPAPSTPPVPSAAAKPAPKGRNQQELEFLIERQKEFKMAALNAKKQGDLEQARNHLKTSKGFDSMIEAARNGLRVDLTKVPESPTLGQSLPASVTGKADFEVVQAGDCTPEKSSREETFASLEKALKSQYEMCKNNAQHYSKMGDIANSKSFQTLASNCKKDYDSLQSAFKHGKPPPRYHYENRTFKIVRSNTDLGDQDCELHIVKCINIPLPSGYSKEDMKVHVTYEFPFPNDQPQTGYSETVKHSIDPEFQQKVKLSIDRKNRALARIFRRQSIKFEIKYNRGFLKGDKTLGQAAVKLAPFDNRCEIHESVDLMDPEKGRKAIGGKIEIKIRLREPLTDKDVEILTQKWLVIEAFVMPSNRPISATSTGKPDGRTAGGKAKNANVK